MVEVVGAFMWREVVEGDALARGLPVAKGLLADQSVAPGSPALGADHLGVGLLRLG
jgi:hypothetical protein